MNSSQLAIKFGDLIQSVAYAIFTDLSGLVSTIRQLSPELRTRRILSFITIIRKLLVQILTLRKWLTTSNVIPYLRSLSNFESSTQNLRTQLNTMQDCIYFTHAELFPRRKRPFNTLLALDLLTERTYPHLPLSIFSCGRLPLPSKESTSSNTTEELDINIRAKILISNCCPSDLTSYSLHTGVLQIKKNNLYETYLTLQHLSPQSPWCIVGFRFLTKVFGSSTMNTNGIEPTLLNFKQFENEVFKVLHNLSGSENDWGAILSSGTRIHTSPTNDISALDELTAQKQTLEDGKVGVEHVKRISSTPSLGLPSLPSPPLSLSRIQYVCKHAALAVILRMLYVQSMDCCKTRLWKSQIETDFQDRVELSFLTFRFWRSLHPGEFSTFSYELQIILPHESFNEKCFDDFNKNFVVRLLVFDDVSNLSLSTELLIASPGNPNNSPNGGSTDCFTQYEHSAVNTTNQRFDRILNQFRSTLIPSIIHARPTINSSIDMEFHTVTNGVSFQSLKGDLFSKLAQAKVRVLLSRLLISLNTPALVSKGLEVQLEPDKCSIGIRYAGLQIVIHVNMAFGHFHLMYSPIFNQINGLHALQLFEQEINNILSQQLVSAYLSSNFICDVVESVIIDRDSEFKQPTAEQCKFVHMAPIATLSPLFSCLQIANLYHTWHVSSGLTPIPTQYQPLRIAFLELLSRSMDTTDYRIQDNSLENISVSLGSVYKLASWAHMQSNALDLYDAYSATFPMSIINPNIQLFPHKKAADNSDDRNVNSNQVGVENSALSSITVPRTSSINTFPEEKDGTNSNAVVPKKRKGPKKLFQEEDDYVAKYRKEMFTVKASENTAQKQKEVDLDSSRFSKSTPTSNSSTLAKSPQPNITQNKFSAVDRINQTVFVLYLWVSTTCSNLITKIYAAIATPKSDNSGRQSLRLLRLRKFNIDCVVDSDNSKWCKSMIKSFNEALSQAVLWKATINLSNSPSNPLGLIPTLSQILHASISNQGDISSNPEPYFLTNTSIIQTGTESVSDAHIYFAHKNSFTLVKSVIVGNSDYLLFSFYLNQTKDIFKMFTSTLTATSGANASGKGFMEVTNAKRDPDPLFFNHVNLDTLTHIENSCTMLFSMHAKIQGNNPLLLTSGEYVRNFYELIFSANVDGLHPNSSFETASAALLQSHFNGQRLANSSDLYNILTTTYAPIRILIDFLWLSDQHYVNTDLRTHSALNHSTPKLSSDINIRLKFCHIDFLLHKRPTLLFALQSSISARNLWKNQSAVSTIATSSTTTGAGVDQNLNHEIVWVPNSFINVTVESSDDMTLPIYSTMTQDDDFSDPPRESSSTLNTHSIPFTATQLTFKLLLKEVGGVNSTEDRIDPSALVSLQTFESLLRRLQTILELANT